VLPTIRAVLFSSVVLANAGWVHANPAKVHSQVVQELNSPIGEQSRVAEVTHAEQEARTALKRATEAHTASDPGAKNRAPIYADTALEWAKLRNELAQLAALQSKVAGAQKRLGEAVAALKREQAYLEETEARRGRALALLEQLKTKRQEADRSSGASSSTTPLATPSPSTKAPTATPPRLLPAAKEQK
jgi:hypothetical protein